MVKNRVKITDGFWIDLSKVDAMTLEKTNNFIEDDKKNLINKPIYSIVAFCSGIKFVLLTDETSGVSTKCEKFILDNWVNKE